MSTSVELPPAGTRYYVVVGVEAGVEVVAAETFDSVVEVQVVSAVVHNEN